MITDIFGTPLEDANKVMVIGRITGRDTHKEEFEACASALRLLLGDDKVLNPAHTTIDNPDNPEAVWGEYLHRTVTPILTDMTITHLVALDGWQWSEGAALEAHAAKARNAMIPKWPVKIVCWPEVYDITEAARQWFALAMGHDILGCVYNDIGAAE